MQISFKEWPDYDEDSTEMIVPYNGSLFDLQHSYEKLFPNLNSDNKNASKLHKINYRVNLLPQLTKD